jgi:nicotinamidase/pyrazinamidase
MKTIETPRSYGEVVAVTVDMQNDFVLPTGALSVHDAEQAIPAVNAVNEFVRANHGQVVFTQDWHRADNEKHFAKWPVHCVQERAGAALHDEVVVEMTDTIAKKGMYLEDDGYSGWGAELQTGVLFELTNGLEESERTVGRAIGILARITAERGGRTAVLIDGVATDYCDLATGLDALATSDPETTDIYVVTDGMQAVNINPGDGDAAFAKMIAAGAHPITSDEVVRGSIVIDRTRLER